MNYYGGNQQMMNNLLRQKENIENMINQYQQPQPQPVQNFINTNTNQQNTNLYELKKLNENDEVENIGITNDSIFIGNNKMQIKKLDGTIEKYNIEKYYPIDEKDIQIKALNKKIEDLERRLNEPTKSNEPIKSSNRQETICDVDVKPSAKGTSKSIFKSK